MLDFSWKENFVPYRCLLLLFSFTKKNVLFFRCNPFFSKKKNMFFLYIILAVCGRQETLCVLSSRHHHPKVWTSESHRSRLHPQPGNHGSSALERSFQQNDVLNIQDSCGREKRTPEFIVASNMLDVSSLVLHDSHDTIEKDSMSACHKMRSLVCLEICYSWLYISRSKQFLVRCCSCVSQSKDPLFWF